MTTNAWIIDAGLIKDLTAYLHVLGVHQDGVRMEDVMGCLSRVVHGLRVSGESDIADVIEDREHYNGIYDPEEADVLQLQFLTDMASSLIQELLQRKVFDSVLVKSENHDEGVKAIQDKYPWLKNASSVELLNSTPLPSKKPLPSKNLVEEKILQK